MAAPNVVKLPTAAPRKVDNLRYAGQRAAVREARKAEPWRGIYLFPGERQREAENRALAEAHRSPELLIVMTMMELMAPQDRQRLARKVEAYAGLIRDDASAAAVVITRRLAEGSPIETDNGGAL